MTPPDLRNNINSNTSPQTSTSSSYPSYPGNVDQLHINVQMSEYLDTSDLSHQTSEYSSTHPPSSAQPATPLEGRNVSYQETMNQLTLSALGGLGPEMLNPTVWSTSFGDGIPFGDSIDGGSVDINGWMNFQYLPMATQRGYKRNEGVIDRVKNILPEATPHVSTKRPRPKAPTTSHNGEDTDVSSFRKRKLSTSASSRRADRADHPSHSNQPNQPTYARAIAQEIRDLKDDDFEHSCEWCPFYLSEPFKYFNKPWSSCTKQRAEVSHIVTHIVSDHGLIRGSNSKRISQRYITRCSSHDPNTKGKSDCTLCSHVEQWSEQQLMDTAHDGPSLCLRCYEQFSTKRELFCHLQEPSLCQYKEDWPMRRKSRILYSVFCSSVEVPKFRPPPETTAPRDGARKRNSRLKNKRQASESVAMQSSGQSQSRLMPIAQHTPPPSVSPITPALSLSPSGPGSFSGDISGQHSTMSTAQHMQTRISSQQAQPSETLSFIPQMSPTYIPRHTVPSFYSDIDYESQYPSYAPIRYTQAHNTAQPIVDGLSSHLLQPPLEEQVTQQVVGKGHDQFYPGHDSGIGDMDGDLQLQPSDEDFFPSSGSYMDDINISDINLLGGWDEGMTNYNFNKWNVAL